MAFEMMHTRLPEIAEKETRTITVFPGNEYNLPPDEYGLLEMFYNDEDCDCRRVFLNVVTRNTSNSVAFIAYGWESFNYYAHWYLGEGVDIDEISLFDREDIVKIMGPCLNDLSPQSELAPAILKMVKEQALADIAYVKRLKRHYKLFRAEIDKYYMEMSENDQESEPIQQPDPEELPIIEEKTKHKTKKPAETAALKIPKAMIARYEEIAEIIGDFCDEKLDDEYKDLCLRVLAKLCRKRPSPLVSGKTYTWACGIVYAIGSNR